MLGFLEPEAKARSSSIVRYTERNVPLSTFATRTLHLLQALGASEAGPKCVTVSTTQQLDSSLVFFGCVFFFSPGKQGKAM